MEILQLGDTKAIGPLVMEILHFEDLGIRVSLAANAVVLIIGGYQISIAKYLRGVSTLI